MILRRLWFRLKITVMVWWLQRRLRYWSKRMTAEDRARISVSKEFAALQAKWEELHR